MNQADQRQNLKSADEMEEEERAYQSAKLQELIRRGTPKDLQEANKLMKVMAGYDQRNKTDYRAKAAEEVGRVQQKAKILEEMLQSYAPGDEIKEDDVMEVSGHALSGFEHVLITSRNYRVRLLAHILRSRKCVRRNPMTMKPSRNYSRSTIRYTERWKGTS